MLLYKYCIVSFELFLAYLAKNGVLAQVTCKLSVRRGHARPHTMPIRGDLSRGQDDRRCAPYWIGHSPTCTRSTEKCCSGHPRPVTRLWEGPPLGFRILAVGFWGKVGSYDSQRVVRGPDGFFRDSSRSPRDPYSISNAIEAFSLPR